MLSGTVNLNAACANCAAGSSVQFKYDSNNIGGPVSVTSGAASQQWNTVGVNNGPHSLSAQLVGTTVVSSAVSVTVSNVSVPPTCTFAGPSTVTMNSGATQQFTFSSTGTPTPTVDISAVLGVIVSVSGNTVLYRAPTTQANTTDTLDCHAYNGTVPDGFDGVTINVTGQPPGAPLFTSISSRTAYLRGQGILSFSLFGQNFAPPPAQSLTVSHGQLLVWSVISSTRIDFLWTGTIDFFDPGEVEVTLSDPKGSSTTHFLFKGNGDTMSCSPTECFQVNPVLPGGIVVYDRATGNQVRHINPNVIGRASVAWDNVSGDIAFIGLSPTAISVRNTQGTASGTSNPQPQSATGITAITAKEGYGCSVRDQEGKLAFFDMRVDGSTPLITSPLIGGQPTPGAMGTLGSQLVCATFGVEDLQYTVLRVPQNTILGQATLQGLRKASELNPEQGGWRLKIFSSGPAGGIAALLHDEDKIVVFLNASTGSELRRVTLTGFPFRMEADEATGTVIVANWDDNERKTRFDKVNALTGQASALSGTVNFAATGMEVCGSFVCVANRDNAFAKVPIN